MWEELVDGAPNRIRTYVSFPRGKASWTARRWVRHRPYTQYITEERGRVGGVLASASWGGQGHPRPTISTAEDSCDATRRSLKRELPLPQVASEGSGNPSSQGPDARPVEA